MQEIFLHYIWQYQKITALPLKTIQGEALQVLNPGQYHKEDGPDFFNARLIIGNQHWAGNVEIHLKSSDWYHHRHEINKKYDPVILHVVWEHDIAVFRPDDSEIPVLVLKDYVPDQFLSDYYRLIKAKNWIFCEKDLLTIEPIFWLKWKERLFLERLERKVKPIQILLKENKNDWEATLFCCLAKSFGLNSNSEAFYQIARAVPFTIIRKERYVAGNLEALFLGMAALLDEDKEDRYFCDRKRKWKELMKKYRFHWKGGIPLQFYKVRPDNFPTIRLVQLAGLYQKHSNLFDALIHCNTLDAFYKIFTIEMPEYWNTHYRFDTVSPGKEKVKKISISFRQLLFINAILPLRFLYARYLGNDFSEELLDMAREIAPERNSITDRFKQLGITIESAFDSQAMLQLKKEYCNYKRCLHCDIGKKLLG
ncbi:DUF2851 family protein [Flavobacterium sp. CAU 1735]|uniref:DUF2851 family protein n=1 Tax=Flavobacterium sp. CAU 1735 TaxID=3140361 RepID=UPI0032616D01